MKQKILLLFVLLFITSVSKAQDTEFWFVAPDLIEMYDSPTMLAISNTAERAGEVTITLYNNGSPITTTNTISAHGFWKYDISAANKGRIENPRGSAGNVTCYGVHITSTVPITAYYQILNPGNQDIFILKGSNGLGTEFYVPMINDSYYFSGIYATIWDQIDIVASEDATIVTVVPTKDIRIGASGSSAAGTAITRMLDKGGTLKIMEHVRGNFSGAPTLAGTKITSNKPIAVSVTEDHVGRPGAGYDVAGDQLVPIDAVGQSYIVVKGFLSGLDRVHIVATVNGTIITVNDGGTPVTTTLNAGNSWIYSLGAGGNTNTGPQAIYVTANNPIYCYHVSGTNVGGNDELGAALLPSTYSIGQTQLSFYQNTTVSSDLHYAFAVFRTGTGDKFFIKEETGSYSALSSVTPIAIPGVTDWQTAKISLPPSGQNKVITIKNTNGPFSLGYFAATIGGASYGYLSAFGSFRFPYDIIYKCSADTYTLFAGFADSYKWEYSTTQSGPYTPLSETSHSLTVTNGGYYRLEMVQNTQIVSDVVLVKSIDFQASITQSTTSNITTFSPSINPDLVSDPNLKLSYLWEFSGGTPTTSTDENPLVTWSGNKLTAKLTVTGEANSANSTGGCTSEAVYLYLISGQDKDVCMGKADITIDGGFVLPTGTSSYRWQSSKDNALWENIMGETSSTLSIPALSQKRGIIYYRVLLNDGTNPAVPTGSARIRFSSCQLPVNHNISVMEYYD